MISEVMYTQERPYFIDTWQRMENYHLLLGLGQDLRSEDITTTYLGREREREGGREGGRKGGRE